MDRDSPEPSGGRKIPKLPDLKIPKLPKIAVTREKALAAAGTAVFVVVVAFIGGAILLNYSEDQQIAAFHSHVSASEADLFLVSGKITSHMRIPTNDLSVAECDAHVREFAAIANYGRAVTAYHRQIVAADTVPGAYAGARSAYVRALDNLNRAFTFWSSAAGAYEMRDYSAANRNIGEADRAWREYNTAITDYDRELRAVEEGTEVPPA
ncbi:MULTISPECIES: hypothetical protein [Methanoculleus]|uniref:Uncharacterized protein n=2 Tax=Methanoculleus TaxID=45989 RepID=A3CYE9_METMJ|nr:MULTISPECIES: hypothetical protein [Methanoculleus]ABN58399.1 hypothetical protein Memar_2478 [Methanoculleus marisnigri JR1]MCC7554639.1 hypothetical protein [Methanoculleus marisnigri]UYU17397.1 hypothetical protein OH143_06665 [Methanoculleus submarinus]